MIPSNCTSVIDISALRPNTFIDLIIARVLVVRNGKFFTITDFESRLVSGMNVEVVVNYSDEWNGHPSIKSGDVVVLRRFKKLKGFKKENNMLYFNRKESSVMFYNAWKLVYGKHAYWVNPERMEELKPGSDSHKYVVRLIDDWDVKRKEPPNPRIVPLQVKRTSTLMTLKEAFDSFHTSRLVTIKGKLFKSEFGQFCLTDSFQWVARLEGFSIEDALEHHLSQEITSYIRITNAKRQQGFMEPQVDKARMRIKITDISSISTLYPQERRLVQEKLLPPPKRVPPKPTPYIATPDQSRERVSTLENLDVWEPGDDELDDLFAEIEKPKPEKSVKSPEPENFIHTAVSLDQDEAPQTPDSEADLSSDTGLDADDLNSLTDFIYYGSRGLPITRKKPDPPPSGPSMVTSTPNKGHGSGPPPHELTAQLLQCVAGSSDSEEHYSSPVRKRAKTKHIEPLSRG